MAKTKHPDSISMVAYIDGASRGNPGPAGCSAVLLCDGQIVVKAGKFLGKSTNNRAEYEALLLALRRAAEFEKCTHLKVLTDSQLVARQITGRYKVKDPNLKLLHNEALELAEHFDTFEIKSIPRAKNETADKLANKAIDKGLEKHPHLNNKPAR